LIFVEKQVITLLSCTCTHCS